MLSFQKSYIPDFLSPYDRMLIEGPASTGLTQRLSERIDEKVIEVERKKFPDGEIYVRLEGEVEGEDCVLIQTTYPNEGLIELFFLLDALRENGAGSVTTVVPYFGYGRQDKKFEEGEPISARAIARRIQLDSDLFYTVDIHSKIVMDYFDIDSVNLSAMPWLADHAKVHEPDLLISPDEGGIERVKRASQEIDVEWDYLQKKRINGETIELKPKKIGVEGKVVMILDDIISTGGTMTEAAKQLLEQGAEEVHAGATHGLFAEDALERLDNVCGSVFCTDTIEGEKSEVTIAPLLEEELF